MKADVRAKKAHPTQSQLVPTPLRPNQSQYPEKMGIGQLRSHTQRQRKVEIEVSHQALRPG